MKLRAFTIGCALISAILLLNGRAPAQETHEEQKETTSSLAAVELIAGYGQAALSIKDEGRFYPVSLGFNYDIKPWARDKLHINTPAILQFQIEPSFAYIGQPESNVEVTAGFNLKIGLAPQDWRVQPYAKFGAGLAYMTQNTYEQGSQFNFFEQGGMGINLYITGNTALTLEGRARHISNADIVAPNKGINVYYSGAGITYRF